MAVNVGYSDEANFECEENCSQQLQMLQNLSEFEYFAIHLFYDKNFQPWHSLKLH